MAAEVVNAAIWKFRLGEEPNTRSLPMPVGATALHVHEHEQNGEACLWALVDPDGPQQTRTFHVVESGRLIAAADKVHYVGTAHLAGPYVLHVFELLPAASKIGLIEPGFVNMPR